MSTGECAVKWTPSTYSSAPASWTTRAIAATAGRVPIRLEAAVTATRRVRSPVTAAMSSAVSSPVAGSKSAHRTVAPAAAAACTQGRMLESWSSRVTTTSSPGAQPFASVREKSYANCVALRPKTTPDGCAPSRSASARRAPVTIASALRSPAVPDPRLDNGFASACATASITGSGVWVPPGPSKGAFPAFRAGNCARTAAMS